VSSFTYLDLKDDVSSRVPIFHALLFMRKIIEDVYSSELSGSYWDGFIFLSSDNILGGHDLLSFLKW
jgi:hypothetical protein